MPYIEKRIAPRGASGARSVFQCDIPAIIHQTFVSADLPARTCDAAHSWIDLNPGFEYRFYDDDDQIELIANNFDRDVCAAYEKLPRGAFRADLWRYCMLFQAGGVYADIDTVCQTGLASILKPDDRFVVPNAGMVPYAAFNAFIASTARHPILERVIEFATGAILNSDSLDGYAMVGPGALGKAINLSIGKPPRTPHNLGPHSDGRISYRIIEKRSQEKDHPRRVVSDNKTVLLTKYDGYRADLEKAGIAHWTDDKTTNKFVKKAIKAVTPFAR